jgi:HAD superfamily hydrolase (TIGR01509 family)
MPRLLPHLAKGEAATNELVAEFFQGYSGDWGEFDRGTVDEARLVQRIAWRTELPVGDVQKVIDAIPVELQPMPRSIAMLQRLREQGHRLFFLSNMPLRYAEYLESTHSFMTWFQDGVFSSRVNLVKPEPGIFREAARRFGASPDELLFVDDFALNVKAARTLGWQAVHFLSSEQCEADLASLGAR